MVPSIKHGLEKSRVFSIDQHRENGDDSQHRVRTFETNGAHTRYTTIDFSDWVTTHEIGEAMNRGAKAPFFPCNNT
jgi:hypothetical protein